MPGNVWDRLYEDGLDKMEAKYMIEEQPFPFTPEILETSDVNQGEVFDRLYEEGVQRQEGRLRRLEEEQKKFKFQPNGSKSFDDECWNRLYQEGMCLKEKLARRRMEPTSEALTFKPQVTPYFPNTNPGISIFDRLYEEAKVKKEVEERRKSDSYAAIKQMYGFRPAISSNIPGRGKAVYTELYQDAMQKKQRTEELAKKIAEERKAEGEAEVKEPEFKVRSRRPMPEPTEDWSACPFTPKINDVKGVTSRYMLPRRRYEPLPLPVGVPRMDPLCISRQPWISPLEAKVMEAREQERGRRSRSAGAEYRTPAGQSSGTPAGLEGLRTVPSWGPEMGHRKARSKSVDNSRPSPRNDVPSPVRTSAKSPESSPDSRFRYVLKSPEETVKAPLTSEALELAKGDVFRNDYHQSRSSPGQPFVQSSSGLRTWTSYSNSEVVAHPTDPGSPSISGLMVRRDVTPVKSVSRTVDRNPRIVDLT